MQYIQLGNFDLQVSKICMGCMGFGVPAAGMHSWTLSESASRKIIKYGLHKGINFFDTAMGYQGGTSEEFLGRAIRDFTLRQNVILATKFIPRTSLEIENNINGQTHIQNMIDGSLKRLGTDYIDLYIYHMWDYKTPLEEIMEGLHNVIKAGKARYIGISNCYAWQIAKANELAKANGWETFISVQGHYNLIFREEEREMIPYCRSENIALTPYSPLASGRLSRPCEDTSKRMTEDTYAKGKYASTAAQDAFIINRVAELAKKHKVTMTEIALSWLLTKVAAPVVGATKLSHIDGAVSSTKFSLSNAEIDFLEELYVPHKLVGIMAEKH